MSDSEAVLRTNEAFYQAFADADFRSMDDLWSAAAPVSCIHPGWSPLSERSRIMESWRMILGGESAAIACRDTRPYLHGALAWVTCFEVLQTNMLAATNIFAFEEAGWKMVHHHASPVAQGLRATGGAAGSVH